MTEYDLTKKKPQHKPSEYVAICEWHRTSGSRPYYWENLQQRAAEQGAPLDATYECGPGEWATVSGLAEGHPFRNHMATLEKK